MLVRTEATKNKNVVLVVDEIDKYIGEIHLGVFHKHCVVNDRVTEIDEYFYFTVDKEKTLKYCKK